MIVHLDAMMRLLKDPTSAARLSVFHLKSYLVGVQTAQLVLHNDTQSDEFTNEFEKYIFGKYGGSSSTYLSVFFASRNHLEAAHLWLQAYCECAQMFKRLDEPAGENKFDAAVIDVAGWLPLLESKPLMIIGLKDVTHLRAFFDGVEFVGRYFGGLKVNPDLSMFEKWLRRKRFPQTACSWDMLLVASAGGDNIDAFTRFFHEFRDFEREILLCPGELNSSQQQPGCQ